MPDLREQLQQLLEGRVCLMGLGNVAYGDDGFGVRLAEALATTVYRGANAQFQNCWDFSVSFPLTPDLSLGESENPIPSPDEYRRLGLVENRATCLPLPKGEGRGEGEAGMGLGPCPHVFIAGTTPERWISRVVDEEYDHLVFLDAVEFGGTPGSVVLLDSDQMAARFPQISTHKLSLGLLAKRVEANGRTKAWLLGAQPQSLRSGEELTPAVRATLELILVLLKGCLHGRSRGNEALTSQERWLKKAECLSLVTSAPTQIMEVMA
jgi:hydrogenase maturation protease